MNLQLPEYDHTQSAPLYWLLLAIAFGLGCASYLLWHMPIAAYAMLASAVVDVVLAFSFADLTVRDEGDALAIRFGPLPLFRKRIPYDQMVKVEPERSSWLDGWGIHFNRQGWIFNLWGFDCVRVTLHKKSLRIGTDDRDGLCGFLENKLALLQRDAP